jgi:hypothetical protein
MLPTAAAIDGSVTNALPPDHAGEAGKRAAAAEHEHEHARHVMTERLDHVGMGQRSADDEADACPAEHPVKAGKHRRPTRHHEHAIRRILRLEDLERAEVERRRDPVVDGDPSPDQVDDFLDQVASRT